MKIAYKILFFLYTFNPFLNSFSYAYFFFMFFVKLFNGILNPFFWDVSIYLFNFFRLFFSDM